MHLVIVLEYNGISVIYEHCYAHCLNLVLVDSTKRVSKTSNFFSLMELCVFLSRSVTFPQETVLTTARPSSKTTAETFRYPIVL